MGLLKHILLPVALAAIAYFAYKSTLPVEKVVVPENGWYGRGSPKPDDTKIVPFEVKVPEDVIKDLHSRLKAARISHEVLEDSDNFHYGFNVNYLKKVRDYWVEKFDWAKQEKLINSFKQFTTEIEGLKIHFYHAKPAPKYKKVLPILMVHGWPGNVFEFHKVLPLLTDPAAHGLGDDLAFEVIAPSIPGYGWSEQPKKTGFSQVAAARVFKKLMLRLGFNKFYLQGGDWGAAVTSNIARAYPQHVIGLHLNMMPVAPGTSLKSLALTFLGSLWPKAFFAGEQYKNYNFFSNVKDLIIETGYMHIQGTKPDTVGTALNDSPLGLAAYILEKFSSWTNLEYKNLPDGGLTKKFTMDELLTIVTIYWVNGNIVSSQRFYREAFLDSTFLALRSQYCSVPTAHAHFPGDLYDRDPQELKSLAYNLTAHYNFPDGGHFAALEVPRPLAQHVFQFARGLENNYFP